MTISSAVPAEIADRLQDKRERDAEKIVEQNKDQARANIEARMLASSRDGKKNHYPATEIASEATAMLNTLQREQLADAIWQRDECSLGRVLMPVIQRYFDEYFEDHPDVLRDECLLVAALGDDE